MNLPAWLKDQVDKLGAARLAGEIKRQEAVTLLRDAIIAKGDWTIIRSAVADFAGKALDDFHRTHQHELPVSWTAQVQAELFPDLPARLFIRPGVAKPVIAFTAHDWDMARNVIEVRTRGAKDNAEAGWAHFEAAYDRVRPLLVTDSMITADVAEQIRAA